MQNRDIIGVAETGMLRSNSKTGNGWMD
jgi:hypothetical protein